MKNKVNIYLVLFGALSIAWSLLGAVLLTGLAFDIFDDPFAGC